MQTLTLQVQDNFVPNLLNLLKDQLKKEIEVLRIFNKNKPSW